MKTLYYMCLNYCLSFVTFALAQLSVQVFVNSFWHREVLWVHFSWYKDIICFFSKPYSQNLKTLFIYFIIYLFIYLFSTYLFFFLFYLAFCFQLLFCLFTLSFTSSHGLFYIIYYASFSLSRYVPNLLLLVLQYHYLISTYLLHIN